MRKSRRRNNRGVTLIELLVVMIIIALITAVAAQRFTGKLETANRSAAKNQISELEGALDLFHLDVGRFPTAAEGLEALRKKPATAENWDGPYLKKDLPVDPWKRPYVYRFPGEHGDFDLLSYGPDGVEGGEGEKASDIVSWK